MWFGCERADRAGLFAALALSAAVISGCAGVSNTLSQQEIAGLKLTGVSVTVAPDAKIQWEDGQKLYGASKGWAYPPQVGQSLDSPEAKAYLATALAPKLKNALEKFVASTLSGSRPVRLDVVVRDFDITTPLQRVVIGGAYSIIADVNVVDARTGAVILAHPKVYAWL
jgi:hypothetical protein